MANVKFAIDWGVNRDGPQAVSPGLFDRDPLEAGARRDVEAALAASPHPRVREIAKHASVLDGLSSQLAYVRRYAVVRKYNADLEPVLSLRLDAFIRAVEKARKVALAVPRRNQVTDRWCSQLVRMMEEARQARPSPEDPRRKASAKRASFVQGVLTILLHRGESRRFPLTREPQGFAAAAVEAACKAAGFTFPNDDKERRTVLELAYRVIESRDPSIKRVKAPSSVPRRRG